MVAVGAVLFGIQHFQQCGAGVAPVVRTHLVNFVQQQHRVAGSGLGHGGHDTTGHRAHIGLAVAADVGLVMNTAQGNANHLAVQAARNGIGNGGLAHARRANQAQNLRRHLGCHLAHSNGFQNALLHLFHAKVVMLQNPGGCLNIQPLFGGFAPGQLQNGIQIVPQDGSLRRTEGLLFQLRSIFQELAAVLLLDGQGTDAGGILVVLLFLISLAQLLPDGAHLLPEVVVPLILVNGSSGLVLNFRFQLQHFQFFCQETHGHFQTAGCVELEQKLHLFTVVQAGILSDRIGNEAVFLAGNHPQLYHLGGMVGQLQIGIIKGAGLTAQCLPLGGIRLLRRGNGLHQRAEEGLRLLHLGDFGTGDAGNQHPQILIRGVEQLLDLDHRAHSAEVSQLRLIHQDVLLGHQQQNLVFFHGRFQSQGRFGSAHIKMNGLLGVDNQSAQRQHRHHACISNFRQRTIPPYWGINIGG